MATELRIQIRDPVPFWPLDPGSGMGKKSGSGSGMTTDSLETIFWVKYLILWCGSGMEKIWIRDAKIRIRDPGSGSGMNNPDHISESLETIFWVKILKFFDADPGSGMQKIRIQDAKNSDPGSGINLLDPQHCLMTTCFFITLVCSASCATPCSTTRRPTPLTTSTTSPRTCTWARKWWAH